MQNLQMHSHPEKKVAVAIASVKIIGAADGTALHSLGPTHTPFLKAGAADGTALHSLRPHPYSLLEAGAADGTTLHSLGPIHTPFSRQALLMAPHCTPSHPYSPLKAGVADTPFERGISNEC
ncbi:unnamed protein product [Closterium sp. NIES-64]|nr:unnamed protein product [Closterium sp. NIES-64]